MLTHNLGFPRIGGKRELKYALEKYWKHEISCTDLLQIGRSIRFKNWMLQKDMGIDLIPSNDFSYYDHVLDTTLMLGNIPERFWPIISDADPQSLNLYFSMARGLQNNKYDIQAMEMTKWFNTNYHYIVPEFYENQNYRLFSSKIFDEYLETIEYKINSKPVIIGPVSYIMLGKIKSQKLKPEKILADIVPIYKQVLNTLEKLGCTWIQIDEPILTLELDSDILALMLQSYNEIRNAAQNINILLTTYFGEITHNFSLIAQLPINALHLDLVSNSYQLDSILKKLPETFMLSLGIVDGRNIWKNNFEKSLQIINVVVEKIGMHNTMIAPSCSLLHIPYDIDLETDPNVLPSFVKNWLAFAKQKLQEINTLAILKKGNSVDHAWAFDAYLENLKSHSDRLNSAKTKNHEVDKKVNEVIGKHIERKLPFSIRKILQQKLLKLPILPITTIGSFPQTAELRKIRNQYKKEQLSEIEYKRYIRNEIEKSIRIQEELGIDVLVHGEFERNDMVEYFGEQLNGFAFTENGWVQSYGSRCVKPPIIYGDISRPHPMTIEWTTFAQSLTQKPVKGMLTGPYTILKWSFVRDDKSWIEILFQIAIAINEEILDLEKSGIKIIQIDEPAIREGLPLRKNDWDHFLSWVIKAFKYTTANINNETQIHTHMCYSEFNDIIQYIAQLDADVITIEASRSDMELLKAFYEFKYPNDIGPGIYDIHSPRIPKVEEIKNFICKALAVIPYDQLWINPDCGLKTRGWPETIQSLRNIVEATQQIRVELSTDKTKDISDKFMHKYSL